MSKRLILVWLCLVSLIVTVPTFAQGGEGESAPPGMTIHVVQRGDTLFKIAQAYGTTVEAIVQANGINNPAALSVGQRLLVPNPNPSAPGVPTAYIAQPGDSLTKLAVQFGTSRREIARRSRITNPHLLFIGQQLALNDGSLGVGIQYGWIHRVKAGETLYQIAMRYAIGAEALAVANRLRSRTEIYVGQPLIIPDAEGGVPLTDLPPPLVGFDISPAEQGRTFSIRLTTSTPTQLAGTFLGIPLLILSDESRTGHVIIVGIDSLTPPGLYPLMLTMTDEKGVQSIYSRRMRVADGSYPQEALTISADNLRLLDPAVTEPEAQQIRQLVSKITPTRYFGPLMGLPSAAPVSSQFGTRRTYNNGALNTVHTGTDFAGLPSSAIVAPANGVVVFAGPLDVRGNATIIDHGWGIFSGYWHQETIGVQLGQMVEQGQPIGTVGSTGRVTGPHLHWELFVNGVQVDPLQWARQSFP
ncbi:MAG: hypothetical protein OHK0023_20010 [Anaerolineae bacterium]